MLTGEAGQAAWSGAGRWLRAGWRGLGRGGEGAWGAAGSFLDSTGGGQIPRKSSGGARPASGGFRVRFGAVRRAEGVGSAPDGSQTAARLPGWTAGRRAREEIGDRFATEM